MVKKLDNANSIINQEETECSVKVSKTGLFIPYDYCNEHLSPFGGSG